MANENLINKAQIVIVLLLTCFSLLFVGSTTNSAAAEQKVFKWRATTFIPRSSAEVYKLDWAADELRKRSNGRLDIKWFYAAELMPSKEIFDNVITGVVEMAHLCGGYVSGVLPEGDIEQGLPGVFRNSYETYNFLYDSRWKAIEKLKKIYAKKKVVYLHVHKMGVAQDFMFKRPIKRLEDLKGKKVRTFGLTANWIEKAGAATVWFPGEEMYSALSRGTVDGVSWAGASEFWDLKIHEVAKYYLPGVTYFVADNTLVNKKAWNSLPGDLKLMLELVMAEASTLATQETLLRDEMALEKMIKDWGVTVCELPYDDLEKWYSKAAPIWDKVAAETPMCAELIRLQKAWMKWRGYLK